MKRLAFLFMLFFASASVFAQPADKLLKNLQDHFYKINDLSADFTQLGNSSKVSDGKIYYQKGNKYRIELKNMTIVSNGESVWNYNKKDKKVVINDVTGENSPFSLENIIVNYPRKSTVKSLGTEKLDGSEYSVLSFASKNDRSFRTARIWFSAANFVKKVEIVDAQGGKYGFELSDIQINKNLNANRFSFQVPEGIKVIDLR